MKELLHSKLVYGFDKCVVAREDSERILKFEQVVVNEEILDHSVVFDDLMPSLVEELHYSTLTSQGLVVKAELQDHDKWHPF